MDDPKLRSDIYLAITSIDDVGYKAVLTMMLRMMDMVEQETDRMYQALNGKLDTILRDEKAIKTLVLNGTADHHDEHHMWIGERIKSGGYCDFALNEIKIGEQNSKSKRNIAEGVLQNFIWLGLTFVAGAAVSKFLGL